MRKNLLLRRNDSFLNREASIKEGDIFAMHNAWARV